MMSRILPEPGPRSRRCETADGRAMRGIDEVRFAAANALPGHRACRIPLALAAWMVLALSAASAADTNLIRIANHTPRSLAVSHEPPSRAQPSEEVRSACIRGRRYICGQVMQIVPQGLVVFSGYTNLMRPELKGSWLIRGNVSTSRPANLVEGREPDAICAGLVFLTDIPKRPAVKLYDYVAVEAYPAGHYHYAPVPNVNKMIRRFSVGLLTAVVLNLDVGEK